MKDFYHLFLHYVTSVRGSDHSVKHVYFKIQVLNT